MTEMQVCLWGKWRWSMCTHAKSLQSCLTFCDPVNCSMPGSSVHGIFQPKILEWVAMPTSRDLPNPGIEPISLMSPELTGGFFTTCPTWGANLYKTPQQKSATIWAWGAPNIHGSAKRVNRSFCSSSSPQVSKTSVSQSYSIIRITCGVWKKDHKLLRSSRLNEWDCIQGSGHAIG